MEQLPTRAYSRSGFCTGQPGISTLKCVNFKAEHWNAIDATFQHGPRTAPTWDKPLIDKEKLSKSRLDRHLPQASLDSWHTPCAIGPPCPDRFQHSRITDSRHDLYRHRTRPLRRRTLPPGPD